MLKLKAKYLLSICIFLICGQKYAFAESTTFYSNKESAAGFYMFTDSSSQADVAFTDNFVAPTRLDELRKQATFENDDLIEAEQYEEMSSLRKSAENPGLYSSPYYSVSGESVFNYSSNLNFVHKDTLYPCINLYILLQVFRI